MSKRTISHVTHRYLALMLSAILCFVALPCQAAPANKQVKKLIKLERKIRRLREQAVRGFENLSTEQQGELLSSFDGGSSFAEDIDQDHIPDVFEPPSNACEPDSDGDGILDGDDADPVNRIDGNGGGEIGDTVPATPTPYTGRIESIDTAGITLRVSTPAGIGSLRISFRDTSFYHCYGRAAAGTCSFTEFRAGDQAKVYAYEENGIYFARAVLGSPS
jgi:hypothetical protein